MARAIGRGLGLVDPLIEAIALAHDLGHPAFGHAGERALAALVPGGFHHAAHGVRVVTELEPGLSLEAEVVDGILKHSKGRSGAVFARGGGLAALTREALVVRAADLYAYACHDLDDAYLLGLLSPGDLPQRVRGVLGSRPEDVRDRLVTSTIVESARGDRVALELAMREALEELRAFLYERLYESPPITRQTAAVRAIVAALWESAQEKPREFQVHLARFGLAPRDTESFAVVFVDAVAALTDRELVHLLQLVTHRESQAFSVVRVA
jgi:dGTPase